MNIYSELYAELAPARQFTGPSLSGIVAGDHRKGPGFESSTGNISSKVIKSLNTDLSDLSD